MNKTNVLDWLKCRPEHWGPIRSWRVGGVLGISAASARAILKQLEADGEIVRSERYSTPNCLAWEFPRTDEAAQAQAKGE